MKTLKKRLQNSLSNFYLLQGEDYYLYDRAFSMIKNRANIQLEDFNLSKFDDENFSMQAVIQSAEAIPMASDYKIILVKNISKITKSDENLLLDYLKNPSPSSIIVIFDFFNKFDFIKSLVEFVDCKRFDRKTSSIFLVNEFAKRGKQISQEALDTLLDYCNGYLTRAVNEIDKLAYFDLSNSLITKNQVQILVNKDEEFAVFELTEALGQKNADKALKILNDLIKEQGLLGLITNHFRRLFFIAISDLDDKSLANLLGVKEYAISKQKTQIKNFSKLQLKKIFSLLEDIDFNIKSGAMLQENALYYLVLSILYI